jgi:hypothetical protein
MWKYAPERGPVHRPGPIEKQFGRTGVFVFLGGAGDADAPDYEAILDTLDRLMPLYRFVEGASSSVPASASAPPPLRPGCPARTVHATASLAERLLNINLRHNGRIYPTRCTRCAFVKRMGFTNVPTSETRVTV